MKEQNPRAWSIDGECWCTRVDYDGYKKEWSGVVPVLAPDNRSKRIGEIADTNIIVEFPTGLKDNNGKDICEGDIVRYVSEGEDIYLAVIKRKDEDKEQSCWLTGFIYEPFATVDEEELTEEEYESLGGMEVIGNIHENPELQKE